MNAPTHRHRFAAAALINPFTSPRVDGTVTRRLLGRGGRAVSTIRDHRLSANLSQTAFAERLGVSGQLPRVGFRATGSAVRRAGPSARTRRGGAGRSTVVTAEVGTRAWCERVSTPRRCEERAIGG